MFIEEGEKLQPNVGKVGVNYHLSLWNSYD